MKRFFKRIKHLWNWFRLLKDDFDFDYHYLLEIEQHKLKNMLKFFTSVDAWTNTDKVVRDLKLCIKLIDIILERDEEFEKTIDRILQGKEPTFYINVKNCKRFYSRWDVESFENYPPLKTELRRIKALRLYNKIRNNIFIWWD